MWLFALNMTWSLCEVYWDLDFEPSENQWRAANGIWGVRYLAWRLVFVLDFDNWSMGAKPWTTSGGQPVVFGLSGNPKPRKVINKPAQFKQTCLCSLMVNGSTLWVMYQGFMHLDTETRAAELHWSFLFLVNLAPLSCLAKSWILDWGTTKRLWHALTTAQGLWCVALALGQRKCYPPFGSTSIVFTHRFHVFLGNNK